MSSALTLLTGAIRDLHITNFNAVSITALLAYEIVITFDQEIEYIWRSRWSMVKILYILIRYYAMFFLLMNSFVTTNAFLSQRFCHYYNHFQIWGAIAEPPLVDCLIVIRIYALYGQNKTMGVALVVLWLSGLCMIHMFLIDLLRQMLLLAEYVIIFALLGFAWTPFESIPNPLPGTLTGCVTNFTPRFPLTLAFWGVASAFQSIYVVLSLFRLRAFVRTTGFSKLAWSSLIGVFFRDGAAYFVIILAAILVNTFIDRFGSILLVEAGSFWAVAIPSIAACRLVLNIRDFTAPSEFLTESDHAALATDMELHDMRFHSGETHVQDP